MQYHDIKPGSPGYFHWDVLDIEPGDLVHAPATIGYKLIDLPRVVANEENLKIYKLQHGLMLVLAKIDGVPVSGTHTWDNHTTYVVQTRHGALAIVTTKPSPEQKDELLRQGNQPW